MRDPWAEIASAPDPDNLPVDCDAVAERARRIALLRDAGSAVARGQDAEEEPCVCATEFTCLAAAHEEDE